MKIYISGQITGLDLNQAKQNFKNCEYELIEFGFSGNSVLNAFEIKPFLGIKKWLAYMITDLYQLSKCTHIAMQNNWTNSRGACIEYYFAKFIFKLEVIWL
jgi:hypothetical protein